MLFHFNSSEILIFTFNFFFNLRLKRGRLLWGGENTVCSFEVLNTSDFCIPRKQLNFLNGQFDFTHVGICLEDGAPFIPRCIFPI